MFSKKKKKKIKFFCPQIVEKNTLKSCTEKLKSNFFSLLPWTAQTAQRVQNVAYRPTVYRTGVLTNDITAFKFQMVCYPVIGWRKCMSYAVTTEET